MTREPGDIIERDGQRYRLLTRLERDPGRGHWWAVPVDEGGRQIGTGMVEVEV